MNRYFRTILILAVCCCLLPCQCFAERSSYYQVKVNGGPDNVGVSAGLFDWRFAGINDHAAVTLMRPTSSTYVAGVDVGGGLWFIDVGGVVGAKFGPGKTDSPVFLAVYPEIMYPVFYKDNCFFDISARYYFTTERTNFFTAGVGFAWEYR